MFDLGCLAFSSTSLLFHINHLLQFYISLRLYPRQQLLCPNMGSPCGFSQIWGLCLVLRFPESIKCCKPFDQASHLLLSSISFEALQHQHHLHLFYSQSTRKVKPFLSRNICSFWQKLISSLLNKFWSDILGWGILFLLYYIYIWFSFIFLYK